MESEIGTFLEQCCFSALFDEKLQWLTGAVLNFSIPVLDMVTLGRKFSLNLSRRSFRSRSSALRKSWVSRYFNVLAVCFLLIFVCFAADRGYLSVFLNLGPAINHGYGVFESMSSTGGCNIFYGSWVRDSTYPLYNSSHCPFAERGFNCEANQRKDKDYMKWRWKPHNCDIQRFDVREALERFRGLRIVFVGDSMSRTQWESLICLLMTGIEDTRSVYEIYGHKITKQIKFLGILFSSHNFTVEYFRSPFLVQQTSPPRHAPKRIKSTLKLDKLEDISENWIDSDILVFNSGHWWTPAKTFQVGCYFQVGNSVKLGMQITTAYRTAISTWASWVETRVNTSRTRVFFRTFETSHWSDFSAEKVCRVTQYPMSEAKGLESNAFSDIISETVAKMEVPVIVLHITYMASFRSDAHIGEWSDTPTVPDCSHWCLPGVPDTWNEMLLSYVLKKS